MLPCLLNTKYILSHTHDNAVTMNVTTLTHNKSMYVNVTKLIPEESSFLTMNLSKLTQDKIVTMYVTIRTLHIINVTTRIHDIYVTMNITILHKTK